MATAKNVPFTSKDSPAITTGKARNNKPATAYAKVHTDLKDDPVDARSPTYGGGAFTYDEVVEYGIETRGNGAATKGRIARGPMA